MLPRMRIATSMRPPLFFRGGEYRLTINTSSMHDH